MLTAFVALGLAAAPVQTPSAACARCSLTHPDLSGGLPREGFLLAQAELPPPPMPPESGVAAPAHPPQGTLPVQPPGARELELEREIDALNRQIRSIDTNWPAPYIVLAYAGYLLAPSGVLGGAMFVLLGLTSSAFQAYIVLGAVMLVAGLAGVAAIVFAVIQGNAVQEERKRERQELIDRREALEHELRLLRSRAQDLTPRPVMLTIATF